jgi:hypothetical protein
MATIPHWVNTSEAPLPHQESPLCRSDNKNHCLTKGSLLRRRVLMYLLLQSGVYFDGLFYYLSNAVPSLQDPSFQVWFVSWCHYSLFNSS